jgi:hypothetical protein
MDVDNEHSDGGSQPPPSAEHTPQGTSAQVGGASGNPTPTSVQSANTPSTASGNAPIVAHSQNSKRRRGLGVVTPNACTECRKKRAKTPSRDKSCCQFCDGVLYVNLVYTMYICICAASWLTTAAHSVMGRNHAGAAEHKKMSNVYMKYQCASPRRICEPRSRPCVKSNDPVIKFSLHLFDLSYGKGFSPDFEVDNPSRAFQNGWRACRPLEGVRCLVFPIVPRDLRWDPYQVSREVDWELWRR